MRKAFLLLVIQLSVFSCLFGQAESDKLNKAYKKKSIVLLRDFFEDWHKEIKPISDSEFSQLNDTIKEAYNVFESFYNPKELKKYDHKEDFSGIYKNLEFAIIQNSIKVYRSKKAYYTEEEIDSFMVASVNNNPNYDSSFKAKMLKRYNGELNIMVKNTFYPYSEEYLKKEKIDDTINFRPRINVLKPLYLIPKYINILNKFLLSKTEDKRLFLENYIGISQAAMGLNILTFPSVRYIVFDEKLEYAQVNFNIGSDLGHAFYKKVKNEWIFIRSEITGVY